MLKHVPSTSSQLPVSDVKDHFEAFFNRESSATFTGDRDLRYFKQLGPRHKSALATEIEVDEVRKALGEMNASSSPGMFGLDVPALRNLCANDIIANYVTGLLNMWIEGQVGDHLLLTFLTAIPKPDRD
jgi:hypothetical protein